MNVHPRWMHSGHVEAPRSTRHRTRTPHEAGTVHVATPLDEASLSLDHPSPRGNPVISASAWAKNRGRAPRRTRMSRPRLTQVRRKGDIRRCHTCLCHFVGSVAFASFLGLLSRHRPAHRHLTRPRYPLGVPSRRSPMPFVRSTSATHTREDARSHCRAGDIRRPGGVRRPGRTRRGPPPRTLVAVLAPNDPDPPPPPQDASHVPTHDDRITSHLTDEQLYSAVHAGGSASTAAAVALRRRHWARVSAFALTVVDDTAAARHITGLAFDRLLRERPAAAPLGRPPRLFLLLEVSRAAALLTRRCDRDVGDRGAARWRRRCPRSPRRRTIIPSTRSSPRGSPHCLPVHRPSCGTPSSSGSRTTRSRR